MRLEKWTSCKSVGRRLEAKNAKVAKLGTPLQVGQAEFAHQTLFRHDPERGQDAGLDCHLRLPAGGYRAQGT